MVIPASNTYTSLLLAITIKHPVDILDALRHSQWFFKMCFFDQRTEPITRTVVFFYPLKVFSFLCVQCVTNSCRKQIHDIFIQLKAYYSTPVQLYQVPATVV